MLAVYFVWDTVAYKRETIADKKWDEATVQPLRLNGWVNVLLLCGIVACVALVDPNKPLPFTDIKPVMFARDRADAEHR